MKFKPLPAETEDEILPDGVYIGLPEQRYFGQRTLGSTCLAKLWNDGEGYWWASNLNPYYVRKPSDPLDFGSAFHALGLEGREAFNARYAVAPDPRAFRGLLRTADEIISALRESEAPAVSSKSRKSDLVEMAKTYLPGRPIWDDILEKAKRKAGDRTVISAEAAYQIETMVEAGMADEIMAALFTAEGGVRLTEVSVFWTLPNGTRLRFRFDSLLPGVNGDLKSIDNYRPGDELADAVGKVIGQRAMDIQPAMSFLARHAVYRAIEEGRVWLDPEPLVGDPEEQARWLARFPAEAPLDLGDRPGWRWIWAFFQKPDIMGRAPVLLPVWLDYGTLDHREGYRKACHALAFYDRMVAERGLDRPWTKTLPPHHLNATAAPELQVRIPSWVKQPQPVADEEAALEWKAQP